MMVIIIIEGREGERNGHNSWVSNIETQLSLSSIPGQDLDQLHYTPWFKQSSCREKVKSPVSCEKETLLRDHVNVIAVKVSLTRKGGGERMGRNEDSFWVRSHWLTHNTWHTLSPWPWLSMKPKIFPRFGVRNFWRQKNNFVEIQFKNPWTTKHLDYEHDTLKETEFES